MLLLLPGLSTHLCCSRSQGLLKGEHIKVTPEVRRLASVFVNNGGSPIGNSRVKLTNVKDCVKRGLVKEGPCKQILWHHQTTHFVS